MAVTQICRKKLGGHHACLGDIVRNISKMGDFCSFSEGSLGRVLQKLPLIEQISIFSINFTNFQFNCIVFVKEHLNLSKIIILPSCAEELRTAKWWNDLNYFAIAFKHTTNTMP